MTIKEDNMKSWTLGMILALLLAAGCDGKKDADHTRNAENRPAAAAPPRPAAASAADWCGGHGLPESMCTKCNPELTSKFKKAGDWCATHSLPSSACPTCNPWTPPGKAGKKARVGKASDWCKGHALPESMCTICNPELTKKFKDADDWCAAHDLPESACPTCNPWTPPGKASKTGMGDITGTRIKLRSAALERAVGIQTVKARMGTVKATVSCTAHIAFDRDRVARISTSVPGIVRKVQVSLGQKVSAGAALFTLESASVGALQERRRASRLRVDAAQANLDRLVKLRAEAITSKRRVELARQELEAARAESRTLRSALKISGASRAGRPGRFKVRTPISGTVVKRPVIRGAYAVMSTPLATVADTTKMWAMLDLPEWDAASVRMGDKVEVKVDGAAGKTFTGKVGWIAAEVEVRTRTVEARVTLENKAGLLRSGQFARATVRLSSAALGATLTIPHAAVQQLKKKSVVFVRTGAGAYEAREVKAGRSDGRQVQVSGALKAGEAVVTTGAFLLRTEMDRESIGAGCCESQKGVK